MTEKQNNFFDRITIIANILAMISVPIGMAVAAMLLRLQADVEVIKSQLTERLRDREKIEKIQTDIGDIKIQLERLKTKTENGNNEASIH